MKDAWNTANENYVASEGKKTLLACVEAEVARRTKKKKTNTSGNGGGNGGGGNGGSDGDAGDTITFDPAAVIALRPTMDAWIKKTATDLSVSQTKVRTIMLEAVRFVSEHGPGVVGPALMLDDEDLKTENQA